MIELRELQASARRSSEAPSESQTRALAGQVKQLRRRCEVRMLATRSAGVALPRLERLVEDRHLTPDERLVVLVLQADIERGAQLQIRSRRAQAGLKI